MCSPPHGRAFLSSLHFATYDSAYSPRTTTYGDLPGARDIYARDLELEFVDDVQR